MASGGGLVYVILVGYVNTGCLKKSVILEMMKASIAGPAGAIACTVGTQKNLSHSTRTCPRNLFYVHPTAPEACTIEAFIIARITLFFRHPVI